MREFLRLELSSKITPWLTYEDALRHVATKAANKSAKNPEKSMFSPGAHPLEWR